MDQAQSELQNIWKIVHEFYKTFGFSLKLRLSLHDPKQPEKYLGEPKNWKEAEDILRQVAKANKTQYEEAIGEAAFYGPKLDFMATDSLGREWQVATIQIDMNMPERFDLFCIDEKGGHERVVMLHAAIMGSIERFLSILIEHYAGALPLWLSAIQVSVLPISKKQNGYAKKVLKELRVTSDGLRVELDDRDESVGKKIREASMQKIPYQIIVGEKEVKAKKISVRTREGKDLGVMQLEKFISRIKSEIEKKK